MLDRLVGLETEYAMRLHPHDTNEGPISNGMLFGHFFDHIRAKVPTVSAILSTPTWFVANGGSIRFERIPYVAFLPRAGLVEGSTPECRGPRQLLTYQRAQDALLSRAMLTGNKDAGLATLLKNNRDGRDTPFGTHENYEIAIASGAALWYWRFGLALLTPISILLCIVVELILLILVIPFWSVRAYSMAWMEVFGYRRTYDLPAWAESLLCWIIFFVILPLATLRLILMGPIAFRPQQRQLLAFLVSRPIFAGAGTVAADGRFSLSARADAISSVTGTMAKRFRPIYYSGHVFKGMAALLCGDYWTYAGLFRRRQRLQIAVGDANMAQTAEFLKIGTTLLVLDAIEAGAMTDAPRLRRPIRALRTICADPELRVTVPLANGERWTALQIQRYYWDRCRSFVDQSGQSSVEVEEVLRLWGETLDTLQANPASLVGRLDWVTKRFLLGALGPDAPIAAMRKLDIRYHELSTEGYYLKLEAAGLAPTLIEPDEIVQAIETPPLGTPATRRGWFIREYAAYPAAVRASWNAVIIRSGKTSRTVRLQ
jgi:proteasome accessory factor A